MNPEWHGIQVIKGPLQSDHSKLLMPGAQKLPAEPEHTQQAILFCDDLQFDGMLPNEVLGKISKTALGFPHHAQ